MSKFKAFLVNQKISLSIIAVATCFAIGIIVNATIIRVTEREREIAPLKAIVTKPITEADHTIGDVSLPIRITVFFDAECVPCRTLHAPLIALWKKDYSHVSFIVYRHNPLRLIHTNAQIEAEASECVFQQGGNDGFWDFLQRLYDVQHKKGESVAGLLDSIANEMGLNSEQFKTCLQQNAMKSRVDLDANLALRAAFMKTPTVIVSRGEEYGVLEGANVAQVKSAIEKYREARP